MPRRRTKSRQKKNITSSSSIRSVFQSLDTDDNGRLSASELRRHFQEVGLDASLIDGFIATADVDGDDSINFEEFERICLQVEADGTKVKNVPKLWKHFVSMTFTEAFLQEINETKELADVAIKPLQMYIKSKSKIDSRGFKRAPRHVRFFAECLDCCFFLPLFVILVGLICSPLLVNYTDDAYRMGKDIFCNSSISQGVTHMVLDRPGGRAVISKLDAWCDPSGTCPELFGMLDLNPDDATKSKVRRAYRKKSLLYHPDKACLPSLSNTEMEDCLEEKTRLFHCLTEAKETLMDDDKKDYYMKYGNLDEWEHYLTSSTWTAIAIGGGFIAYVLGLILLVAYRVMVCTSQGPGKYVVGINVVNRHGDRVGMCTMFIRNLLKLLGYCSIPIYVSTVWLIIKINESDNHIYQILLVLAYAWFPVIDWSYRNLDHYVVFL